MASNVIASGRVVGMRCSKQEYDALQKEAERQGYKISHLLRHRVFGKHGKNLNEHGATPNFLAIGTIINQLSLINLELGENGTHLRLIAESLDVGFRDAFGLDFCLRLLERLNHDLKNAIASVQNDLGKADGLACLTMGHTS